MDTLRKYFPGLTAAQAERFGRMQALYEEWNAKINVISRKDIGNLMPRHVLHSLSIAKIAAFEPGTAVLDVGTGGGFPGIPLAVMFPQARFRLIDSTGKKIFVASRIAEALGLENVSFAHMNAAEERGKYDFIVARAVGDLSRLVGMTCKNVSGASRNRLQNGIIALKGGDFRQELQDCRDVCRNRRNISVGEITEWSVQDFFPESIFEGKYIIHIPLTANART